MNARRAAFFGVMKRSIDATESELLLDYSQLIQRNQTKLANKRQRITTTLLLRNAADLMFPGVVDCDAIVPLNRQTPRGRKIGIAYLIL